MRDRFVERSHALAAVQDAQSTANRIREYLANGLDDELRAFVDQHHPADLADAMQFLSDSEDLSLYRRLTSEEAAEVLDEVGETTRTALVRATESDRLAEILGYLPSDEGADLLGALSPEDRVAVFGHITDLSLRAELARLVGYPADTAGGVMSLGYVDVDMGSTQAGAIARFRDKKNAEHIFFVYVVDAAGRLIGMVDLRTLLTASSETPLSELWDDQVVTVQPDCDQEQVAGIFARYDLTALPVVDLDRRLLGVITADDIIDVIQEEADEDVAHMVGSDASELERKSPAKIAMMRMPWIMATLFIELFAGIVIKFFDHTIAQVLLLASFMPIISAISGNTGLQSAAIIIRGLSTGHVRLNDWRHAVARQLGTTLILGAACGIVLGIIGALWYGKWTFGVLVTVGMFMSVNIAGAVGTAIPLTSKRLGFDPALTAGPFETAFQDVVGISIFLGMATLLLPWLK